MSPESPHLGSDFQTRKGVYNVYHVNHELSRIAKKAIGERIPFYAPDKKSEPERALERWWKYRTSHRLIQAARAQGNIRLYIRSVDVFGTPERTNTRGKVLREHARGESLRDLILSRWTKKEYDRTCVRRIMDDFLDVVENELYQTGIKVGEDFNPSNIIVSENTGKKIMTALSEQRYPVLEDNDEVYVNIDPDNWSFRKNVARELVPGIEIPPSRAQKLIVAVSGFFTKILAGK